MLGTTAASGAAQEEPAPVLSQRSGCCMWVQGTWWGQEGHDEAAGGTLPIAPLEEGRYSHLLPSPS